MARRPTTEIKISGARELRRDLRRAGAKASDLSKPNRKLAQTFIPPAAGKAPYRTGRLAASVKGTGTTTKAILIAGSISVPYAGPIHYGWPSRPNPARGWRGGPISPQPFLTEVVSERYGEIVDAYQRAMDDLCREVDP